MFRAYVFNEMAYPHYKFEGVRTMRTELPNNVMNPDVAHELLHKYHDIWLAADELGLNIMLNEHHQTPTCLDSTVPLHLAVLARQTRRARLLAIGVPVGNRTDPVRIAEELATIDVMSRGRLDAGVVLGAPHEVHATNTDPTRQRERFWEATDLLLKAMTTHDGPFNWEGKHYHHRQVNIWPRPYQEPHPPIWVSTLSTSTVVTLAERDFTAATVFVGTEGCAKLFNAYRARANELGRAAKREKMAYTAFVYVGETDEEAFEVAKKLQWFLYSQTAVPPQYHNVPGYQPAEARSGLLREQLIDLTRVRTPGDERKNSVEIYNLARGPIKDLIDKGMMFCGSPETVFQQLKSFYNAVGGFGNLLMMAVSEHMGYGLVTDSLERFAKQVMPRFIEEVYDRDPNVDGAAMAATTETAPAAAAPRSL